MQVQMVYRIFKWVGYLVLLLLVVGILYASAVSVTYWKGIGV